MEIRFDNQVAVVTGSARGIGYAIADILVSSGAKVAMVDIMEDRLAASAAELSEKGEVKAYPQDLRKIAEIAPLVETIRADMGEIDVLIQPAAVGPQCYAEDVTEEEWDDVFAINAKALFFVMREVVGQSMRPRKKGAIVNFASIAGIVGMRKPLCSPIYSASKGAAAAIIRQAAMEWAEYGITVNGIASGGVLTEMTMSPHRRQHGQGDRARAPRSPLAARRGRLAGRVLRQLAGRQHHRPDRRHRRRRLRRPGRPRLPQRRPDRGVCAPLTPTSRRPPSTSRRPAAGTRPGRRVRRDRRAGSSAGRRRWIALAACVAASLCAGIGYAWSVFQKPLAEGAGWSTADIALSFTALLGAGAIASIVAGKAQQYVKPRTVILVGGALIGARARLPGLRALAGRRVRASRFSPASAWAPCTPAAP